MAKSTKAAAARRNTAEVEQSIVKRIKAATMRSDAATRRSNTIAKGNLRHRWLESCQTDGNSLPR